jgi:hypothetical protein
MLGIKHVLQAVANPDLPNPASGGPSVSALTVMTPPQGNTEQLQDRYFHCSMTTACFFRKDGKKLPFQQHFFKTNILEDIQYLEEEIRTGNQYVRLATESEVGHAKLLADPMGTVREAVKNDLSLEELQRMIDERRAALAADPARNTEADRKKIEGTELNSAASSALKAQGVQNHAPAHAAHTGANLASLASMVKSK